jgi:lipopolysaccharide biosynthesis glycosyltransferase
VSEIVDIVVGFDQREAVAYHTFTQSIIEKSTMPVRFLPLSINSLSNYNERHNDGSNDFIYSRFLVPHLMNFKGWAIYADGDMICLEDIKKLWNQRNNNYAVQVVKHDYQTKIEKKYFGNKNENYPRKNWSSLILWNSEHPAHKILTPEFIEKQSGAFLHRFSWIKDEEIGELEKEWNWLALEYEEKKDINLIHYTIGTPCFKEYENKSLSSYWKKAFSNLLDGYHNKRMID